MTALQAGKRQQHKTGGRPKRGWLFGQWVPEGQSSGGAGAAGGAGGGYGGGYGGGGYAGGGYAGSEYGGTPASAVAASALEQTCCTCNQVLESY